MQVRRNAFCPRLNYRLSRRTDSRAHLNNNFPLTLPGRGYHSLLEIKDERCQDFPRSLTASKQQRPRTHIDVTSCDSRVIECRQGEPQSTISGVTLGLSSLQEGKGRIPDVLLNQTGAGGLGNGGATFF